MCDEVNQVLDQRLAAGDPISLSNGKLLERLLTILLIRRPELKSSYTNTVYEGEPEDTTNFFTRLIEVAEPILTSIKYDFIISFSVQFG